MSKTRPGVPMRILQDIRSIVALQSTYSTYNKFLISESTHVSISLILLKVKGNLSWAELPGVEDIEISDLLTNDAKPKIILAQLYDQLVGEYYLGVGDTIMHHYCIYKLVKSILNNDEEGHVLTFSKFIL